VKYTAEKYDLDDATLVEDTRNPYQCMVWRPSRTIVVLGRANNVEDSLHRDCVQSDGVPVIQRPSGGDTVVLTPAMLCVSVVRNSARQFPSSRYFHHYNGKIVSALQTLGVRNLSLSGISDIAIGNRKILGSSIYRNKDRVFYHAVLNVAQSADLLEQYLRIPRREPDYRRGRSHRDFVTSIHDQGYRLHYDELRQAVINEFENDDMELGAARPQ